MMINHFDFYWPSVLTALFIIFCIILVMIFKSYKRKQLFKAQHPNFDELNAHWEPFENFKLRSDQQRYARTKQSLIDTHNND